MSQAPGGAQGMPGAGNALGVTISGAASMTLEPSHHHYSVYGLVGLPHSWVGMVQVSGHSASETQEKARTTHPRTHRCHTCHTSQDAHHTSQAVQVTHLLQDLAAVHERDLVCVADGGQAVSHHDAGAPHHDRV